MQLQRNALTERITFRRASTTEGHQRGREPVVSERSSGTEADWGTWSALSMSPRYLNNVIEQDHRAIKRRVRASQGFRAFHSAWRTIEGIETMNIIRKGQIRWLPKNNIAGQAEFVSRVLGIVTAA